MSYEKSAVGCTEAARLIFPVRSRPSSVRCYRFTRAHRVRISVFPFHLVTFDPSSTGQLALVMYEWSDVQYLGAETPTNGEELPVSFNPSIPYSILPFTSRISPFVSHDDPFT
jgi:hypothetical protein